VGFLGDVFSAYDKSGIYHYAEAILDGLVQNDSDTLLFVPSNVDSIKLENVKTEVADYFGVSKAKNNAVLQNLRYFPRNLKLSVDLNREADVVYSPQCRVTDLSYCLNLRIPMLTTLHDIHGLVVQNPLAYKVRFILRYTSPILLSKKRRVYLAVPTDCVKKQVTQYLHIPAEKIRTVPAPIIVPESILRMSKEEAKELVKAFCPTDYVLFIGRQKAVPTVLSVSKLLKEKYGSAITVVIAGLGIEKLETQRMINELGLSANVLVIGEMSEYFKWILLKAANVFVFPSTAGFGIPPVEAMSVGTPVVSTNTGPLPEVIADGGLLVEYSAEKLAESIYQVYSDPNLSKKLESAGKMRVELFQPKKIVKILLQYLGELTQID
jgi:glycosyltransferase involved in cell wall biosynthesis